MLKQDINLVRFVLLFFLLASN